MEVEILIKVIFKEENVEIPEKVEDVDLLLCRKLEYYAKNIEI
jgi:hypothetical protein